MAAQLIPTIEREQLDFSDPNIRIWNAELIVLAAIACRHMYKSISELPAPPPQKNALPSGGGGGGGGGVVSGPLAKLIASLSFKPIPKITECLLRVHTYTHAMINNRLLLTTMFNEYADMITDPRTHTSIQTFKHA